MYILLRLLCFICFASFVSIGEMGLKAILKKLPLFPFVLIVFVAIESEANVRRFRGNASVQLLDPVRLNDGGDQTQKIIQEAIDREVVQKEVQKKWAKWKKKGVLTEYPSTEYSKEVVFSNTKSTEIQDICNILQYFPILEKDEVTNVKYTIPVDGKNVKLVLERNPYKPGGIGKLPFDQFEAKFLYPDPSKPTRTLKTDLTDEKGVTQELIASTNNQPELRKAVESALPRILEQDVQKTGTFEEQLENQIKETEETKGTKLVIRQEKRDKAFRNAMETLMSTSILRKKPNTWISDVSKKVSEEKSSLSPSVKDQIVKEWRDWKTKGIFTEKASQNGNPKEIRFTSPSSVSINEIFHKLQYFNHLETVPVLVSIPFDYSGRFALQLAPDGSGFTAKGLRHDKKTQTTKIEIDLSKTQLLMDRIKQDFSTHEEFDIAVKESFPTLFTQPEKGLNKKQDLFKEEIGKAKVKKGTTTKTIQGGDRILRNSIQLIASSIIFNQDLPKEHVMAEVINDKIKPDFEKVKSKFEWNALKAKNKIIEDSTTTPKTLTFQNDAGVSVQDIYTYLQNFPSLESGDAIVKIPVDGKEISLKLLRKSNDKFEAKMLFKDRNGRNVEKDLSEHEKITSSLIASTQREPEKLTVALESTLPDIMKQKLDVQNTFETKAPQIPADVKNRVFRQSMEAMASKVILGKEPAKTFVDTVNNKMEISRNTAENNLNEIIKSRKTAPLKVELASSLMRTTEEARTKWAEYVSKGYIKETFKNNIIDQIKIKNNIPLTLKETFKLLQHFIQLYPNLDRTTVQLKIPIGGEERTVYLKRALHGVDQIELQGKNKHWQGTSKISKDKKGNLKTDDQHISASYEEIVQDRGLGDFPDPVRLGEVMLEAIHSDLNRQPNFNKKLEITDNQNRRRTKATLDAVRATVEFMLISMVGEAAHVPDYVENAFTEQLAKTIGRKRKFPDAVDMPSLEDLGTDPITGKTIKAGRSPTADEVVIKLLIEMKSTGMRFDSLFVSTADQFPFMDPDRGTKKGRLYLKRHGDQKIPSSIVQERAAADDVGATMAKRARMSCTGTSKRRRRDLCSLEQIDKNMIVDEKSIKVEDDKVSVEIVDRRDATKRKRLDIPISPDELATTKLVKQRIEESRRSDVSQKYAKINRGLAIHGMVFSAIGAINYFERGDNVRGGIAVTQSLHSLGGLTGFNKIASSAAKQALRHSAIKIAKGLKMEKGLARFSSKVEKFMEKGVGRLMGDLPGVGLAFDIYFIKEDIDALSHLDLNNPEDVKLLPLRVVDLVLDVDTTVLNLIGTFCPAAEVITEPLIIVLSIVRMAIDDFYVDIMEEMDKVNWNSPWAGFQFIGALFKGIINGAVDFLTGGLRRQMENYSKQEKADKKFLARLKNTKNYFKITGTSKYHNKTIDFTKGPLALFGGFINFRLNNDGTAHLEVGDASGQHETIKRTFKIDDDVNDIVLGIGESRKFVYETKTAKLWMFIPVKDYEVIKGANLRTSSLYGIYYGNDNNNKFYAVQGDHPEEKGKGKEKKIKQNDYGKFNITFATGHYHYDLYGNGGSDTFFLGPQLSHVTGGLGSDVYIVQSYGGNTVIDNFSEDKERDMVIIKVKFNEISCHKKDVDLHILYKQTHNIRITNWFVPGSPTYYRHISFKSLDGIIFLAKDYGSEVKCTPIAIEKTGQANGEVISLEKQDFLEVKQVVGTDGNDVIQGNDLNNILDGGKGVDLLTGGKNEDTYIIREKEGCDTINNKADDFETTTDVVLFNVNYERIMLEMSGNHLNVYDSTNKQSSCFKIENWKLGKEYQHLILTSLDHVVFKIKTDNKNLVKFPMVLDYSSSTKGVRVDLQRNKHKGYIHKKGFDQVATVSDSKHSDHIFGNKQSNFLSCTGGKDYLYGDAGSDNYIVKKSCKLAVIINFDPDEKVDLLLLDYNFMELRGRKHNGDFYIYYDVVHPKVILKHWYTGTRFQHLWMRTKDGITVRISNTTAALDPVEISKDPVECQCKGKDCQRNIVTYDLSKDPWKHVTRFQLNSSLCSYNITGNHLNNYIDPGSGNGYNYQHLKGRRGADTYVLKHGYGEFNIIDNHATDNKKDTLKLGLELNDIQIFFHGSYDVILSSKARPSSLAVRMKDYFKGPTYQHLQIITSDQVTFEIKKDEPFMKIITLDLSRFDSPQSLSSQEMQLASQAQTLRGVNDFPNTITGTASSKEIDGGSKDDQISGGPADNIIDGKGGNDNLSGNEGDDIIFGGDGDDIISGGNGNDYIYGGNGKDSIDGGPGDDTMAFKGDSFDKEGVYVDLSGGFGKKTDAEGDTYKSIENVYGTIQNDVLIGSDSNNNLYGSSGDDVIYAKGGSDKLVGGDGTDRYMLEDAYGVKFIDNYSKDKQKDLLSLSNVYSKDVCLFLVGNDLHLYIENLTITTALLDKTDLTVIVHNWNAHHEYRHMNILFKDTYWPNHILALVHRERPNAFRNLKDVVHHIGTRDFKFTPGNTNKGVGLSWNIAPLLLDETTKVSLFHVDIDNPKNIGTTEIASKDVDRGQWVDPLLKNKKHYMLSLVLKYCSTVIASTPSLTYYGEKKPCQPLSVSNSRVTFNPQGSYSHGTKATITCNDGYMLDNDGVTYKQTCLDGKWLPKKPSCVRANTCNKPELPENGKVTDPQRVGKHVTANYSCNDGFKLQGSPMRYCGKDEKWLGESPTCERMSCLRIPKFKHGSVTQCKRQTEEYGTMEQPKHGFCVKLKCNQNYIEQFKVNDLSTKFSLYISLAKQFKSQWFCRNERWKGAGEPECVPAFRLNNRVSSWHGDQGILQQWDDTNDRWIDSSNNDIKIHKLACSNSVGMGEYSGTPKAVIKNNKLQISCPKIRFVDKVTPFEGSLEVLVNNIWQPTCLLAATEDVANTKRLKDLYRMMCHDLGVAADDPGIAYIGHGCTSHVMSCKDTFTNM